MRRTPSPRAKRLMFAVVCLIIGLSIWRVYLHDASIADVLQVTGATASAVFFVLEVVLPEQKTYKHLMWVCFLVMTIGLAAIFFGDFFLAGITKDQDLFHTFALPTYFKFWPVVVVSAISLLFLKRFRDRSRYLSSQMSIIGRTKEEEDFSRWLSDFQKGHLFNDNVLLISIWGFGGVGKTTLLRRYGELCIERGLYIIGFESNKIAVQQPGPSEPLAVFLNRVHPIPEGYGLSEFETISRFVGSLPQTAVFLMDEFRAEDVDFVAGFEWMVSQMNHRTQHRFTLVTACRPRPRFTGLTVDHFVGTEKGLQPLTHEQTRQYLAMYWPNDPRNQLLDQIFRITWGNPKVINYLYASEQIFDRVIRNPDAVNLNSINVIQVTWEFVEADPEIKRVVDVASVVGVVSIDCPNMLFDLLIDRWYELRPKMLDRSFLEVVGKDSYKVHDLLRDHHYERMRHSEKEALHKQVGELYERKFDFSVVALEHYLRAKDVPGVKGISQKAFQQMERHSDFSGLCRLTTSALDMITCSDEIFCIELMIRRGSSNRVLTDYATAESDFQKGLSLYYQADHIGHEILEARLLWGLGEVFRRQDRFRESLKYYDRALYAYTALHDEGGIANALRGKSAVFKMISRYPESIAGYEDAMAIFQSKGDVEGELYCERGIAAVKMLQGDYASACSGYTHSLEIYRQRSNPRGIAYALWGQAESWRMRGDIKLAMSGYQEALELSERIGDEWSRVYLTLNMGECNRALEDYDGARIILESIRDMEVYIESRLIQAHVTLCLAENERLAVGSSVLYEEADVLYRSVEDGFPWGLIHTRIGRSLCRLRDMTESSESDWQTEMKSIIQECRSRNMPAEIDLASRILLDQDTRNLHPLSYP